MPSSTNMFIQDLIEIVREINPISFLDVGLSFGKCGIEIRKYTGVWDVHIEGVQIFPGVKREYNKAIYDKIHIGDALQVIRDLSRYDMIMAGDIIKHMNKLEGIQLIHDLKQKAKKLLIISIPIGDNWIGSATDENPYSAHLASWSWEDLLALGANYGYINKLSDGRQIAYVCFLGKEGSRAEYHFPSSFRLLTGNGNGFLKEAYTTEYFTRKSADGMQLDYGATGAEEWETGSIDEEHRQCVDAVNIQGKRILEIGFGRGEAARYMLLQKNIAFYCGVDFSPAAYSLTEKTLKDCDAAKYQIALAPALPFLEKKKYDHEFDVVYMMDCIEHIPRHEVQKILPLLNKALTKGGVLVIQTPIYSMDEDLFDQDFKYKLPTYTDTHPKTTGMHCNKYTRERLCGELIAAGFEDDQSNNMVFYKKLDKLYEPRPFFNDITLLEEYLITQGAFIGEEQKKYLEDLLFLHQGILVYEDYCDITIDKSINSNHILLVYKYMNAMQAERLASEIHPLCKLVILGAESSQYDYLKSWFLETTHLGADADYYSTLWIGVKQRKYKIAETQPLPLIVSYYTVDTPYEADAIAFEEHCKKLSLDYKIGAVQSKGSWEENCAFKATFLLKVMQEVKRPLLWVDIDAKIIASPDILRGVSCDFAIHKHAHWQFASGTVFFNNTSLSLTLLKKWVELCIANPTIWDQTHLDLAWEYIIDRFPLKTMWLPQSYTKIFDYYMEDSDMEPVIEQLQHSRNYAAKVSDGRSKIPQPAVSIELIHARKASRSSKYEEAVLISKIQRLAGCRPIYIWGAGSAGVKILGRFKDAELPVQGFFDSDKGKIGSCIDGILVYDSLRLQGKKDPVYIVIGSSFFQEISQILHNMGYLETQDFYAYPVF